MPVIFQSLFKWGILKKTLGNIPYKYKKWGKFVLGDFNWVEMILRSTGAFVTLLVLTRIMGKKQISQLTYFNYVTGITIGSIAGDMVSDIDIPFWYGLSSILWWALLTIAVGLISIKFPKTRQTIDGRPIIIINKGVLMETSLRQSQITLEDLSMMLREKGAFSITEVDYAIIEADGKLSLLKKQIEQVPTRRDLQLQATPLNHLPTELIVDGRIVEKSLDELNLNDEWLRNKLSGLSPKEVFYAQLQGDGTLYYQKKNRGSRIK